MKSIVITGGTGDVGRVVVPRLARDYRCIVVYRSRASFDRLPAHENILGAASLEEAASHSPLHALLLLAGGFALGSAESMVSQLMETNLFSNVRALDALVPHLSDRGRIAAISSLAALTRPPGLGAYAASKAALEALLDSLAKELAPRGITVNVIQPEAMDTAENVASMAREALVPIANVAETLHWLLSDAAQNVTGQRIALRAGT